MVISGITFLFAKNQLVCVWNTTISVAQDVFIIYKKEIYMDTLKKKLIALLSSFALLTTTPVLSLSTKASYTNHIFPNFPCYQQLEGSTDCWAQSIRAMYKYEYGSYIPIESVIGTYVMLGKQGTGDPFFGYNSLSGEGAYSIYVTETIEYYFPSYNVYTNGVLTANQIISQYSNDLMALLRFTIGSGLAHSCAFAGYRSGATSSDVQRVYCMEPTNGQIEKCSYYSNSNVYLRINDQITNYYWFQTVRTDY
jgi:hypothetical protein